MTVAQDGGTLSCQLKSSGTFSTLQTFSFLKARARSWNKSIRSTRNN